MALVVLCLAAFAGLVWGPGRGVGTDDQVKQLATPTHSPWNPAWRERLAPASSQSERLRFGVQGGIALVVLLVLIGRGRGRQQSPAPESPAT